MSRTSLRRTPAPQDNVVPLPSYAYGNEVPISQLPQASPLSGQELFALIQQVDPQGDMQTCKSSLTNIGPIVRTKITTEQVAVVALNQLAPLSHAPNGALLILFFNGLAFTAVGGIQPFSVQGNQIIWPSNGLYSITPGAAVVCVYSW